MSALLRFPDTTPAPPYRLYTTGVAVENRPHLTAAEWSERLLMAPTAEAKREVALEARAQALEEQRMAAREVGTWNRWVAKFEDDIRDRDGGSAA